MYYFAIYTILPYNLHVAFELITSPLEFIVIICGVEFSLYSFAHEKVPKTGTGKPVTSTALSISVETFKIIVTFTILPICVTLREILLVTYDVISALSDKSIASKLQFKL